VLQQRRSHNRFPHDQPFGKADAGKGTELRVAPITTFDASGYPSRLAGQTGSLTECRLSATVAN